jgi:hypothetical protein
VDQRVKTPIETRFLPRLAEAVGEWVPEVKGRSFAVADSAITKENVPRLPLCMLAFDRSTADPPIYNQASEFEIVDLFRIEFWMPPIRITKMDDSVTPFWTYYDYEDLRDTLLTNIVQWNNETCELIAYRGMTIVADALAVTLTFSFTATQNWKAKVNHFGEVMPRISINICTPKACVVDDECEEVNPCP